MQFHLFITEATAKTSGEMSRKYYIRYKYIFVICNGKICNCVIISDIFQSNNYKIIDFAQLVYADNVLLDYINIILTSCMSGVLYSFYLHLEQEEMPLLQQVMLQLQHQQQQMQQMQQQMQQQQQQLQELLQREDSRERPWEQPRKQSREQPREHPREQAREQPRELSREERRSRIRT